MKKILILVILCIFLIPLKTSAEITFNSNYTCNSKDSWEHMCKYTGKQGTEFYMYIKEEEFQFSSNQFAFITISNNTAILLTEKGKCPDKLYYVKSNSGPTSSYFLMPLSTAQMKEQLDKNPEDLNWFADFMYCALHDNQYEAIKTYETNDCDDFKKNIANVLDPNKETCEGLLGDPEDVDRKPPAYFIQLVFTIIKYAAIVIVIVFAFVDFIGAVTSQDNDKLKKATSSTITRLIICIIIFVLPTLIKFFLQILEIYGDCGIK